MAVERQDVYFRGRVQGVGFRYTVCRLAGRYDVTGFVQNLPDGRVRLVAEGPKHDLDALMGDIQDATPGDIRDIERDSSPASGEFHTFDIRY